MSSHSIKFIGEFRPPRLPWTAALLTALWLQAQAAPAWADENARAKAQALFQEAEQAAADLRFDLALEAYRKAEKADPSSPFAITARVRADDLSQHSEGGFAPLKRLAEARKKSPAELNQAFVSALEQELKSFAPGRVRTETRLFVAAVYREKLKDNQGALRAYEGLLSDPAADKLSKSLALSSKVAILREAGDLKAALQDTERFADLAPNLHLDVLRQVRRARLKIAAIAWLCALPLLGAFCFAQALSHHSLQSLKQHVLRPFDLAFAFYLGGVGSLLARLHGGGDVRPFLGLGLGIALLAIVARSLGLHPKAQKTAFRAISALACAVGVFALAFLLLEQSNAGYLESFGL